MTNTTVRVFVVILPPLESMEDTRIENLIAELTALRIRVAHLEAGQEVLDTMAGAVLGHLAVIPPPPSPGLNL